MSVNPRLCFELPIPPSVNHAYRRYTTKGGRRMNVLTKKAQEWIEDAQVIAIDAMNRSGWVRPEKIKVVVEYVVYWPDRRKRDPSNLEKLMLDALRVVTGDDQYVLPRAMDFDYDKSNPRVEVCVYRKE